MRKMTKTVAVLAAMSAMTVASASLAFAATDQVVGLNAVKNADNVAAAGSESGAWGGDDKSGWTFTTEDGTKLKNTWAQIDGVWYYFHKDAKMAQDEIVYLDGESYFFNADGSLMADGWKKITSEMDAYDDIEIDPDLDGSALKEDEDDAYSYYDYVWCYFFENGQAAENEWVQDPNSGLWYYFDELVMVRNQMNYQIKPDNDNRAGENTAIYGFDKNGAMLTGWNSRKGTSGGLNDPTKDADGKVWYYYASNGKMQTKGWKKIDGNWYLFANDNGADDKTNTGDKVKNAYPLVVNTYLTSYNGTVDEYFYLNDAGKMQTGIVTLPKKINIASFNVQVGDVDVAYTAVTNSGKPEINFGSKGAATEGLVNGKYYLLDEDDSAKTVVVTDFGKISNTSISAVTGNVAFDFTSDGDGTNTEFFGRVVKSAFIGVDDDELYLADADGDVVEYKAVLVDDGCYVLFDRYGKAYEGYGAKNKSVVIGGKTYWSTGEDITIAGATVSVFSINKQ